MPLNGKIGNVLTRLRAEYVSRSGVTAVIACTSRVERPIEFSRTFLRSSSLNSRSLTMTLRKPIVSMIRRLSFSAPAPIESMAITAPTPNIIPSIVRKVRSLCVYRLPKARLISVMYRIVCQLSAKTSTIDFKKKFFVPEGHRILAGGGTTGTGCNGARALEGRRTEALVCRPSRARRVLEPIFRWFLHRLISLGASGAEEGFLERYTFIVKPGST